MYLQMESKVFMSQMSQWVMESWVNESMSQILNYGY